MDAPSKGDESTREGAAPGAHDGSVDTSDAVRGEGAPASSSDLMLRPLRAPPADAEHLRGPNEPMEHDRYRLPAIASLPVPSSFRALHQSTESRIRDTMGSVFEEGTGVGAASSAVFGVPSAVAPGFGSSDALLSSSMSPPQTVASLSAIQPLADPRMFSDGVNSPISKRRRVHNTSHQEGSLDPKFSLHGNRVLRYSQSQAPQQEQQQQQHHDHHHQLRQATWANDSLSRPPPQLTDVYEPNNQLYQLREQRSQFEGHVLPYHHHGDHHQQHEQQQYQQHQHNQHHQQQAVVHDTQPRRVPSYLQPTMVQAAPASGDRKQENYHHRHQQSGSTHRVKSVNTERLNATATNMLAEFLRANRPDVAHMAFDFWNIPPDDLNSALTDLFVSVHKPGIPEHQHNGPLDYSATTLKSYFSSLARVFHTNNHSHRGFGAEPFRSGVAVALERRIREMHGTATHPLPSEPPPIPEEEYQVLWNAVRAADDPVKHVLRLFLVTATLFGDVNDSLHLMRVYDFSESIVQDGAYAGRKVLVADKGAVDCRVSSINQRREEARTSVVQGEYDAKSPIFQSGTGNHGHPRTLAGHQGQRQDQKTSGSLGGSRQSSSSTTTRDGADKSFYIYIVDMPELGEHNKYAVLVDYLHHRPTDAPVEFWLQNSNWRASPRKAYYLRSAMGKDRVSSLTRLVYAEASIANASGCVNNSFYLREHHKGDSVVVASAADEGCVATSKRAGVGSGAAIAPLTGPRSASASKVIRLGEVDQSNLRTMNRSGLAESERESDPSRVFLGTAVEEVESGEIDRGFEPRVDGRGIGDNEVGNVELIVKIGGSAVTNKREPHELAARDKFDLIMERVSWAYSRGTRMIICHGAGSFGHFEARKHAVGEGSASPIGVAATHAAVSRLSWNIVDSLVLRGVPAVSVAPLWHSVRSSVVDESDDVSLTAAGLLRRGLVPVIHGDVGYLGDGRTRVLSADELVYMLAIGSTFPHVRRVVFVSDVEGLYTECPNAGSSAEDNAERRSTGVLSGRLVNTVAVDSSGEPMWNEARLTRAPSTDLPLDVVDVTGGMAGKLRWAARIACESRGRIGVYIGAAMSRALADLFDTRKTPSAEALSRCTAVVYRARTL